MAFLEEAPLELSLEEQAGAGTFMIAFEETRMNQRDSTKETALDWLLGGDGGAVLPCLCVSGTTEGRWVSPGTTHSCTCGEAAVPGERVSRPPPRPAYLMTPRSPITKDTRQYMH